MAESEISEGSGVSRCRVLGIPVDAVGMEEALGVVDELVNHGEGMGLVLAVNPEKVLVLREDDFLREVFEEAALLIPDGIGVVAALKLLSGVEVSRVPGADLMQRICAESATKGYQIFLYGGAEEVNAGAANELERRFPGIQIVGRANGYISEDEMPGLIDQINASEANVLFVALGSPRQEKWMTDHGARLTKVKVCQGIGGTLDTIVGRVQRAPKAFQKVGLEWLFRLLKQPTRAKRQLRLLTFTKEVMKARMRGDESS